MSSYKIPCPALLKNADEKGVRAQMLMRSLSVAAMANVASPSTMRAVR